MSIPIQSEVQQILAVNNRNGILKRIMLEAWEACKNHPDRPSWCRKSTEAAIVWENAIKLAKQYFAGDAGVKFSKDNDTLSLVFDDKVLVRFKKGDLSLMARNIPTKTAKTFYNHDVDMYGFTGIQRVQAIYTLDRLGAAIVWFGIVARDVRKRILWQLSLTEIAEPGVLPFPQQSVAVKPASDLARLKTSAQDVVQEEQKLNDDVG